MTDQSDEKSKRKREKVVYTENAVVDEYKWTKLLKTKKFLGDDFQRVKGEDVTLDWIETNFTKPVLVPEPHGLDMKMPPPSFSVEEVAQICGLEREVDVIEVSTQTDRKMALKDWAEYFKTPKDKRARILNVISLEFSDTPLSTQVTRPRIVRELDWIDLVWPKGLEDDVYPKVQLYCLMGVEDSYTDFHIDFGGTSVFYHVISGEKIFYVIEPTPKNLELYQTWSTSPEQSNIFLADMIPNCKKLHLFAGNTLLIPSGWIHAVFTNQDSMVIGGNFLHGYSIPMQLKVAQIEVDTNVPFRFRFPHFVTMHWFAAKFYLKQLKDETISLSKRQVDAIETLGTYLQKRADQSTDMSLSKEDRKRIRAEMPPEVFNVKQMLRTLQRCCETYFDEDKVTNAESDWDSDMTEMEFLDSESDLDQFLEMEDELSDAEVEKATKDVKEEQDLYVPTEKFGTQGSSPMYDRLKDPSMRRKRSADDLPKALKTKSVMDRLNSRLKAMSKKRKI